MNQTITRVISGLVITLIGVGALLDAMNVLPFWQQFGIWWPLLLIGGGVLIFLHDYRQYITSLALIIIGAVLQLDKLNVIEVDVWRVFWPVIIIAVGLSIIINHASKGPKQTKTQDLDSISAILAGNDTVNKSKNYQGGRASAILGGITLDLRDATIKDSATIEVFALCGGIEIKVPREWTVKHSVFPILGGVENKAQVNGEKSPTLYITGTVALGGVEVKA